MIKPTFGAKIGDNFKDSNGTDEDNNQSTKASEKQGQFRTRRNAHQPVDNISFGLNDNFIDLDIELAVPEGKITYKASKLVKSTEQNKIKTHNYLGPKRKIKDVQTRLRKKD